MPRALSDDEFAELMHGCWAGLYRTAYLLVGDHAEAEDLVQTALAKTYANWHRVRSLESAAGYARTTLVNTAASWFRKKGWRNERPTDRVPDAPVPRSIGAPART
ncbi:sigma factor [Nocardioides nitrophenolicus]|uniref:sigma factor n=1 Tax=Nocardioides nitrophenolicus TaxID=60489 RepID=UPI001EF99038|nr:sigma factor [Nocardioides nitrophenolicus]MBM7519411.1 DNA-directed RNA polymerase specialized sigma24 family protein [Nocardioides nitrophenolicus]